MSLPDDFGVEPTNVPYTMVLWERHGDTVVLFPVTVVVVVDDPPPATNFDLPPSVQEWWDAAVRSGQAHGIQTDWTGQ